MGRAPCPGGPEGAPHCRPSSLQCHAGVKGLRLLGGGPGVPLVPSVGGPAAGRPRTPPCRTWQSRSAAGSTMVRPGASRRAPRPSWWGGAGRAGAGRGPRRLTGQFGTHAPPTSPGRSRRPRGPGDSAAWPPREGAGRGGAEFRGGCGNPRSLAPKLLTTTRGLISAEDALAEVTATSPGRQGSLGTAVTHTLSNSTGKPSARAHIRRGQFWPASQRTLLPTSARPGLLLSWEYAQRKRERAVPSTSYKAVHPIPGTPTYDVIYPQ